MKRIFISCLLVFAYVFAEAKVILPSIFQDNMVLQRNTNVAVWGKATAGKTVTITADWLSNKVTANVDKEGKWSTRIQTPEAGGPYTISFKEGENVTLNNVLIGEVWFCSGQSNMEMPVSGYPSQPTLGGMERIVKAKTSKPIRMCTVAQSSNSVEIDTVNCKWKEHTPEAVSSCSATAYFFAETIQDYLDIPVGIIVSCWGGSSIETWMTKETIEKVAPGEFKYDHLNNEKYQNSRNNQLPQLLYNGQVAALIPFTFKGIIWYQGECNRGRAEQYTRLQPAYVQMMRDKFQVPDAPFYFVQIAPYPYENASSWLSGYFREAQAATLSTIAHSGMATTTDLGEYQTIHPCKKIDVGQRLAYLALQNDYGLKGIEAESPVYESMEIQDSTIAIKFKVSDKGLNPQNDDIIGFEIAGEDQVFYPAKAKRKNVNTVRVYSDKVKKPVAVRYCFRNFQEGNLKNNFGIAAGPFRTDNWKL